MWNCMSAYGGSGMFPGMAGMLLFLLLLIGAIVVLVRYTSVTGNLSERRQEKTALEILKERYARGEIERDEFETKKRDLSE